LEFLASLGYLKEAANGDLLKADELNVHSQHLLLFDFHLFIYVYVSQAFFPLYQPRKTLQCDLIIPSTLPYIPLNFSSPFNHAKVL